MQWSGSGDLYGSIEFTVVHNKKKIWDGCCIKRNGAINSSQVWVVFDDHSFEGCGIDSVPPCLIFLRDFPVVAAREKIKSLGIGYDVPIFGRIARAKFSRISRA